MLLYRFDPVMHSGVVAIPNSPRRQRRSLSRRRLLVGRPYLDLLRFDLGGC